MMRKQLTAAVLSALLLTAPVLSSCAADTSPAVMVYENTEITEAMYTYWISGYKNYFLQALGGTDTEAFLNTTLRIRDENGEDVDVIIADYIGDRIGEIIENNCISLHLFDEYGLELPAATVASVNQAVESEIENAGGRKALNEALAKISLTEKSLREMYLTDEKINYLYEYLYGNETVGTTGAEPITMEQYNDFYTENYACVRHIYIRTVDKNVLDAEGNVQYNADGSVLTAELTEEETAAKLSLCDELMDRINAGEDFEVLEDEFSEDSGRYTLTEGYILNRSTALPDVFIDNAFDMEIGEVRRVDASYATHIMLREELPVNGWSLPAYETLMGDFKGFVKSEVYADKIAPMIEAIVWDETLRQAHTVYNTPITSY